MKKWGASFKLLKLRLIDEMGAAEDIASYIYLYFSPARWSSYLEKEGGKEPAVRLAFE